jgi:DNA-binding NtrC family response regulator
VNSAEKTILVVDDESDLRDSLGKVLRKEGYVVLLAEGGERALELLASKHVDLVLTDLRMPQMSGMDLLRRIKQQWPDIEVLVLTAYGTIEGAVEAMRAGAYDFVTKPLKRAELVQAIRRAAERQSLAMENRYLRQELEGRRGYQLVVGRSGAMRRVMEWVERLSAISSTVLITGESGTGKELVARAIHARSPRAEKRFVAINCGAIPESLMESELFGHTRGAFTGAIRDKDGLFKVAAGGTLFLDEIGSVPLALQIKLLRAIEEKEILPVGSTTPIPVDVRIIAASNRDLAKEVERGTFREDLYYRLNVVGIEIPPLRERKEDIPELVQYFIALHAAELNSKVEGIDDEAMAALMAYDWKGNVRELDNVIERAMILCDRPLIGVAHLPVNLQPNLFERPGRSRRLKDAVKDFERQHIMAVLRHTGHDKERAAEILGVSQSSLYRKMAELGIPTTSAHS